MLAMGCLFAVLFVVALLAIPAGVITGERLGVPTAAAIPLSALPLVAVAVFGVVRERSRRRRLFERLAERATGLLNLALVSPVDRLANRVLGRRWFRLKARLAGEQAAAA